jgi:Ni,Fe-hydrogenase III large subunit/Ni,Fe-hydrogenase III component G
MLNTAAPNNRTRVHPDRLAEVSHDLAVEHGARLADLFGEEIAEHTVRLRAVYALDRERRYVVFESELEGDRFSSLSELDPAAFLEECELYEHFGVRPHHAPRLNRVFVPPNRSDAFPGLGRHERTRLARDYEPHVVSGEAFEFPFGPVRAAGWESLYMGLVTTGEEVLDLYLMAWHKHRGVERRLIGLDPERAAFFVERADGLSTVGDTLAFCRAVEAISGAWVPEPAQHTRAVALELERIYNHVAAIAATCQATGLSVGQARVEIVLEQLLRLNAAAFGHRYLFGVVRPGGVTRAPDREPVASALAPLLGELKAVVDGLWSTNSYVDRLEATGIVAPARAGELSLVGPVARGSGQDVDVRRDHPCEPAELAPGDVPVREAGDAQARIAVMVAEIHQSRLLIEAHLPDAGSDRIEVRGSGEALGWAESPRGEALAWLSLDDRGRIGRARLRPASVRNWRAFDDAARAQNVFTDVPIIEASFWLTAAGLAR